MWLSSTLQVRLGLYNASNGIVLHVPGNHNSTAPRVTSFGVRFFSHNIVLKL